MGLEPDIWFWRDNHGTEIDFLLDEPAGIFAMEVKSGMNFHNAYLRNLKQYGKYNPEVKQMSLIYDGTTERIVDGIKIVNWRNITKKPVS